MDELPPAPEGIVLAHFIVSDDVERSKRFYTEVLGGRVAFSGEPTYVALANSWIIINVGGGPTDDKPAVTLRTPHDPDWVSSFLNIRVKDIEAVYAEWSGRGAQFLTPPKQHQYEIRCYIRDPDGHLIEVGQTTDPSGDWAPTHWPSSTSASERNKRHQRLVAKAIVWVLRVGLPDLILAVTNPLAFEAPQIPSEAEVVAQAYTGREALETLLDGFRGAAADMNTRCITAGPTASLILVVAGILRTSLNKTEWLYVVLLVLAGIAVFSAITGLSVSVPFNRVGLAPNPAHAPVERVALRRKEAWARLASGTATFALLALGVAALLAA